MAEYISYIQTENLIKSWTEIQGIKESLEAEFRLLQNSDTDETDDYITTQVIGNKILSDSPRSGKLSDSTGDIAASYQQVMKGDYYSALEDIKEELAQFELVDDKLGIAFKRLSRVQGRILRLFYIDDQTWNEVLDELKTDKCYISKQQAQRQRRNGVYKVQRISKIKVDIYNQVMKLVEVE